VGGSAAIRRKGQWIKGPVSVPWLIRASELPPRSALAVGLVIWRLKGTTRRSTFPLMNSDLERWGIDRRTKSRAVAALEGAGLISVERKTHRWPIITILPQAFSRRTGSAGRERLKHAETDF
jgi:hypothetical protein